MIHQNSVVAFHADLDRFSRRAREILEWITAHGPRTDRQVMDGMGFREPNQVRPRITELVESGALMEVGDIVCPVTGKRVRRVDIRRARQLELLS